MFSRAGTWDQLYQGYQKAANEASSEELYQKQLRTEIY